MNLVKKVFVLLGVFLLTAPALAQVCDSQGDDLDSCISNSNCLDCQDEYYEFVDDLGDCNSCGCISNECSELGSCCPSCADELEDWLNCIADSVGLSCDLNCENGGGGGGGGGGGAGSGAVHKAAPVLGVAFVAALSSFMN